MIKVEEKTERPSEVAEAQDKLSSAISESMELSEKLEEKLICVLSQERDKDKDKEEEKGQDRKQMCPLANDLRDEAERVMHNNRRIAEIIDRVEVWRYCLCYQYSVIIDRVEV